MNQFTHDLLDYVELSINDSMPISIYNNETHVCGID